MMERAFAFYFYAQAATLPVVWGTYFIVGLGRFYTVVYSFSTAIVLLAIIIVAAMGLKTRRFRLRAAAVALLLAVILVRIVFLGLARAPQGWDWVLLVESGVLAWSALILGGTSPYLPCRRACLILSLYWMARATLDIGYQLHWPGWAAVAVWGPTVLAVAAMSLLWMVPWEDSRESRIWRT